MVWLIINLCFVVPKTILDIGNDMAIQKNEPRISQGRNVIGTIYQYSQLDFHVTKIVILSAFILIYELYIIIIKQISVDNSNTRLIRTKNSRSLRLLQNENSRCLRLLLNEISRFNGLPNYWKLLFYECLHWFY
jgi:hypothetical protein